MAAGALPAPGTTYGPCEPSCAHTDCALTREMAASACRYCGEPIGYDTRFYSEGQGENPRRFRHVHMVCEEREIRAKRAAPSAAETGGEG